MAYEDQRILYFCLLLVTLPFVVLAQNPRNISLQSSLSALDDNNSFWISPSGDFAFGFQEIVKGGFLLSIWFSKIPERTIVWSANGQNLAPRGSTLRFTTNGELQLNDPNGNRIWNADFVGSGVAYAAMLDTGNFVLADKQSALLWQTFTQPTDTILPSQILDEPGNLVSRYLETNYSSGRFQFALQGDGKLVLYTRNFPLDSVNYAYWSTQVFGNGTQLVFNQTGFIYLRASNGSIIYTVSSTAPSTQGFYHRATLEPDGVFRHHVYPKNGTTNEGMWPNSWSSVFFIPSDICVSILEDTGGGACGYNSYCKFDETKQCNCPNGYSFIDPEDVMKGCKPDFVPQSCDKATPEAHLFYLVEMPNTDWTGSEYERLPDVDEDWCRQACLADCFCAVAIFSQGLRRCWKKRLPFSNGRPDYTDGVKALIKVRIHNSTLNRDNQTIKERANLLIAGSVLLSSSVFLNFFFILAILLLFRSRKRKAKVVRPIPLVAGMNITNFTYEELSESTVEFKEVVGRGGFGTVYKGTLFSDRNKLIAVKRLENKVNESEMEFENEVRAIGRTNHKNLVQLLGFCNEGTNRILVYEFMSNGSLASFLFAETRPSWYQRIQIAMGTAKGLLYLHEECSRQIIHCDIKPQNILLDDIHTAKISDFGLAKLMKTNQTRTTTAIRGTKGYVAPEWFRSMPITTKVDVYSFGILLLELVCCRRNFEGESESEDQMILTDWACDCFRDRKLQLLVKEDEEAVNDMKKVDRLVKIALWCIQDDPSLRPTMNKVTQMLEGAVQVPVPPDPTSYMSSV